MCKYLRNFEPSKEEFPSWKEICDEFFIINDVKDGAKQRAILLTNLPPDVYTTLKTLCIPAKPNTKTFGELCDVLMVTYNLGHQEEVVDPDCRLEAGVVRAQGEAHKRSGRTLGDHRRVGPSHDERREGKVSAVPGDTDTEPARDVGMDPQLVEPRPEVEVHQPRAGESQQQHLVNRRELEGGRGRH